MDFGNVKFNKNHKIESAAKDASTAIKLLLLAFATGLVAVCIALFAGHTQTTSTIASIAVTGLSLVSFAVGGYGAYLAASALGWASYITVAIVVCALIPYLKFLVFISLTVFALNLVREAGFTFSLFGPVRKKQTFSAN